MLRLVLYRALAMACEDPSAGDLGLGNQWADRIVPTDGAMGTKTKTTMQGEPRTASLMVG